MSLRRTSSTEGKSNQDGKNGPRVNEQIRVREVRVVDEEGNQLGVQNTRKALEMANEAGLDLVEVAPNEQPPVCRIMDYGKYRYELAKKQSRSSSQTIRVKEVRFRPGTGDGDVQVKINNAKNFLSKKDKVLISLVFRGREMAHIQEGERLIQQIIEMLEGCGKLDSPPSRQGKRITCVFSPF